MARMPDLVAFAQRHALKVGTIEDLIAYRLKNDRIVKRKMTSRVESVFGGEFEMHVYETTVEPFEHVVMVRGDLSAPGPVLVRVHAVNMPADMLGIDTGGEKGSLIQKSLEIIAEEGRGVLVMIRDLRPRSVSSWLTKRAANAVTEERRLVEIGVGSQILRDLGISDMVLLTNSPSSRYVGLEGYGLRVVGTRKIE
jgi:3,4-dihydroxy 2-butanone 4-phosphate synthase/GTP cyclohydrolase II